MSHFQPPRAYRATRIACYLGYVTQAISINLLPLLYVTFQREYGLSLERISLLISICFVVQILVDFLVTQLGDRLRYRVGTVTAHVAATAGLVCLSVLPPLLPDPYIGILTATVLMAVGGGLIEVLISPIIDGLPSDEKAGSMSLLHSFYSWGTVAVVVGSTVFFAAAGAAAWRWLPLLWAAVPLVTAFLFRWVPMPEQPTAQEKAVSGLRTLFGAPVIWLLMLLMLCAGAAEQAVSQWASLFAEAGLGVSKTMGDLLGPLLFAVLMGSARVVFGRHGRTESLRRTMAVCALGCIAGYLLTVLSPLSLLSLAGVGLCGLSVGVMWPGLLSLSSSIYPRGGTAMFALLALCGDVGCSLGPGLVGTVSDRLQTAGTDTSAALRGGIAVGLIFPLLLLAGVLLLRGRKERS